MKSNEHIKESEMPAERGVYLKNLLRQNKFMTAVLVILFASIPFYIISQLNQLEAGTIARARLIFPVGFVYLFLGYWAAVLFYPVLYITLTVYIYLKFIKTKKVR